MAEVPPHTATAFQSPQPPLAVEAVDDSFATLDASARWMPAASTLKSSPRGGSLSMSELRATPVRGTAATHRSQSVWEAANGPARSRKAIGGGFGSAVAIDSGANPLNPPKHVRVYGSPSFVSRVNVGDHLSLMSSVHTPVMHPGEEEHVSRQVSL